MDTCWMCIVLDWGRHNQGTSINLVKWWQWDGSDWPTNVLGSAQSNILKVISAVIFYIYLFIYLCMLRAIFYLRNVCMRKLPGTTIGCVKWVRKGSPVAWQVETTNRFIDFDPSKIHFWLTTHSPLLWPFYMFINLLKVTMHKILKNKKHSTVLDDSYIRGMIFRAQWEMKSSVL